MVIHVVSSGESVWSIARAYGLEPAQVAADNQVPADGALAVGQTLVLRFPDRVHTVAPGETVTSIAGQYGLTLRELYRNNFSLGGQPLLFPGQRLTLSFQDQPPLTPAVVNGYAYPNIELGALEETLPYLTALAPFTWGIGADGALLPLEDLSLRRAAWNMGTVPLLHLSTLTEEGNFSTQRAEEILSNEAAQADLIAQVVQAVRSRGYGGADVDFEYIPAALGPAYASFLGQLRQALSPLPLWAALAPKTRADQPGLLYEAHDYAAIGAAVDAALLMTYEWGYLAGPPMAVAPLPNVRAVLDYAVTEIPPEKLLLGLPNYGYDWPLPFIQGQTRAKSLSSQEAIALAVRYGVAISYDETAQSPGFRYTDWEGVEHEVWFEDARSLEKKLLLIQEYGLLGTGIWNLMRPFSQLWLLLGALFDMDQPLPSQPAF